MGSLVRCNICGLYTIHDELLQGAHPRCRKEEAAKMAAFELELKQEQKKAKAAARQVRTLRLLPTPLNLMTPRRHGRPDRRAHDGALNAVQYLDRRQKDVLAQHYKRRRRASVLRNDAEA